MNRRRIAVSLAGASAFLDMYATQPLLPSLERDFGASEAAVGLTISVLTFAVAIAAPLVGPLADALGRKRIIVAAIALLAVATFGAAQAHSLRELLAWRFAQGLMMPGIFATTLAYISEEFPLASQGSTVGWYITGNVVGGFAGRYIAALVAHGHSWQTAFAVLGACNVAGALVILALLPRSTRARERRRVDLAELGAHVREPQLLVTYAAGAAVLFSLVAAFTFITFHLAQPPFSLTTAELGNVFFVYLVGAVATPVASRFVDRVGNRITLACAMTIGAVGSLVTLAPSLVSIIAGLALISSGVFVAQVASQSYIGVVARRNRAGAAGLYLTAYYIGGGLGAIAPAALWRGGGWPATVGLIVAVQLSAALLALLTWKR